MKLNFGAAALALALSAGVASASDINAGQQQIANYLGVNAGAYNSSELAQLLAARNAGDNFTYSNLLARSGSAEGVESQGKAQLAAQAGVDAADFTSAELIQLRNAQRRGDLQDVNFYLSHDNRNTVTFPVLRLGRNS